MIRVDSDTKTAYKTDSVHKDLEVRIPGKSITLTNTDLVAQSLSLTESIESSQNLSFTGCIAATLSFQCADIITDIEGEYIEVDITADETETIPLFRGYIDKSGNHSHEQNTMDITAYDALYSKINNVDVTSWYNSLSFPISIKNMRDSFFTFVGVEQEVDYLPNDPITVTKTLEDKTINGSTIIKAICQINGRFGRMSRTGKFQYVHLNIGTEALYPREDLYPADDLYPSTENALDNVSKAHYSSISFENYRVAPIDKVQLVNKDGTIAASVGSGTNIFTLNNNFLVWGLNASQMSSVSANLFNTIEGLWYIPADIDCVGLPYLECGDFVMMSAKRSIVRSYVLNRTLKGIQALKDTFKAMGDKTQPVYTPSVKSQIAANAAAISTEASRASRVESGLNSAINNEASTRANQINAVNVRCDNLSAKSAQIENLVATKASISDLNASNARIDNLSASKANISDLNASNARISNLEATRVTAQWVQSNFVTASQVSTAVHSAMEGTITCGTLRAGQVKIYTGQGYTDVYSIFRTK